MITTSLLVIYNLKCLFSCLYKRLFSGGSCDNERAEELSVRGREILQSDNFMLDYLGKCLQDSFNPTTNKGGYVNLGTSVSTLCDDIMVDRFKVPGTLECQARDLHYFPMWGIPECREAIANCLSRIFSPDRPLHSDNILVVNGGTVAMEILACNLFDPDDVVITASPCYTRIFNNFNERFKVQVVDLFLKEKSVKRDDEGTFELTADVLENCIKEQRAKGRKVKGFILVNPNNPLGDVYGPELVMELISISHKYNMHFISDEVYSMTIYEKGIEFQSVLNMKSVTRPEKTHVIWSLSKDINLSGMRFGVLITWNKDLIQVVKNSCMFTSVPAVVQRAVTKLLNDRAWLEDTLLPTHCQRLKEAALKTREVFNSLGVYVRPAQAGFFLWVNLRPYLKEVSTAGELALFRHLMDHKVYIIPGSEVHCTNPGWFRIVFSLKPEILDEGLKRIADALKELSVNEMDKQNLL